MQRDSWLALPSVQAQFEREVDAKARELAAEAFDDVGPHALEWMQDEHPALVADVIRHAIPVSQSNKVDARLELEAAIDRLRDRYMDACADDYRDRARELLSEEETT
jgi:hypothetical protein